MCFSTLQYQDAKLAVDSFPRFAIRPGTAMRPRGGQATALVRTWAFEWVLSTEHLPQLQPLGLGLQQISCYPRPTKGVMTGVHISLPHSTWSLRLCQPGANNEPYDGFLRTNNFPKLLGKEQNRIGKDRRMVQLLRQDRDSIAST